jgi:hypothetical protein
MKEIDLEGSLVLEKLATIGKVEEFYDAIDSDNFNQVKLLLNIANIDSETIDTFLKEMVE